MTTSLFNRLQSRDEIDCRLEFENSNQPPDWLSLRDGIDHPLWNAGHEPDLGDVEEGMHNVCQEILHGDGVGGGLASVAGGGADDLAHFQAAAVERGGGRDSLSGRHEELRECRTSIGYNHRQRQDLSHPGTMTNGLRPQRVKLGSMFCATTDAQRRILVENGGGESTDVTVCLNDTEAAL